LNKIILKESELLKESNFILSAHLIK